MRTTAVPLAAPLELGAGAATDAEGAEEGAAGGAIEATGSGAADAAAGGAISGGAGGSGAAVAGAAEAVEPEGSLAGTRVDAPVAGVAPLVGRASARSVVPWTLAGAGSPWGWALTVEVKRSSATKTNTPRKSATVPRVDVGGFEVKRVGRRSSP
jgi:hypothetical protein